MAWIESHETLREHPKTKRAARTLGVSLPTLIGHLHLLWWWATQYAEDGDLNRYDATDIADAAGWEGKPDAFVSALLSCGPGGGAGFLERKGGRLVIHDWDQYAGRLIAAREDGRRGNHERWHVQRGISDPNCRYCHSDIGGDIGGDSGGDILPDSPPESTNQTKPNLPNQPDDDDARARETMTRPPDETADDTPARRQVIEHYCRVTDRTPFTVSEQDRQDIEAALEITGSDPAPLIAGMDALLERRRRGPKRNDPIASFAYFLHIFERQSPADIIAAARDSPNGRGRSPTNGGVKHGTRGGAAGPYDDGEYAGVFGDQQ